MTTPSTIGRGTTIRGSIRGDGDLELHGYVEGTVTLGGDLQISETALVKSDVSAKRVFVRGAVAGNISATEIIILEPGARVVGDVGAPQIGIRPGALVRGNVATGAPLPPRPVHVAAPAAAQAQRGRPAVAAPAARTSAPAARAPVHVTPGRPVHAAPSRPVAPPPVARPVIARPPPAPIAPPPEPEPEPEAELEAEAEPMMEEEPAATEEALEAGASEDSSSPPPPVVPAVPKGAKAQVRRGRGGK